MEKVNKFYRFRKALTRKGEFEADDSTQDIYNFQMLDLELGEEDEIELLKCENIQVDSNDNYECIFDESVSDDFYKGMLMLTEEGVLSRPTESQTIGVAGREINASKQLYIYKVRKDSIFEREHRLEILDKELLDKALRKTNKKKKFDIWTRTPVNHQFTKKKILLMIHGTFKQMKGFYHLFAYNEGEGYHRLTDIYGKENIIGFHHPTMLVGVEKNVEALEELLDSRGLLDDDYEFDILTTSRGCLVARQFILDNPNFNCDRLIMVSPPNQGTPLVHKLENGLSFSLMSLLLFNIPALVPALAKFAVRQLKGLQDQKCGKDSFVYKLNEKMVGHPILNNAYVIASDFKPNQKWDEIIFDDKKNDFVVPLIGSAGEKMRCYAEGEGIDLGIPQNNITYIEDDGPMHGKQFSDYRVVDEIFKILTPVPLAPPVPPIVLLDTGNQDEPI